MTFLGLPLGDVVVLAGVAGAAALAAGAVGAALLVALRRASLWAQLAIVSLTTVAAVAVGAGAAGNAMFISTHDLRALVVIVLSAGVAGLAIAMVLARRVVHASRSIAEAARQLGDGHLPVSGRAPTIREFAALSAELEDTAQRLQEARARQRAMEEARRELVSWVSHDLRTPLAVIRAVTEALEDGVVAEPEDVRRYLKTLRVESDRLAGLVDDLFELSRINSGTVRLDVEPVSLGDLVSDALAAAEPVAAARGVTVTGRVVGRSPELPLAAAAISRVLANLVGNAVRETAQDSSVEVQTGMDDEGAFVAVRDRCGGIAPDDLRHVFETGFRGERARTPTDDIGAGLGLAIARGFARAHGGDVTVANVEGGCCFTLRLPLAAAPSRTP